LSDSLLTLIKHVELGNEILNYLYCPLEIKGVSHIFYENLCRGRI